MGKEDRGWPITGQKRLFFTKRMRNENSSRIREVISFTPEDLELVDFFKRRRLCAENAHRA